MKTAERILFPHPSGMAAIAGCHLAWPLMAAK